MRSNNIIPLFALACVALALSGCGSTNSYQTTQRGPVWVVPAAVAVSSTPASAKVAATNCPAIVGTNQASATAAPTNTDASAPPAIVPPVTNVLSVADIKEMAAKGVGEQTILNGLRASRAIYTLTTQDVTDLQEAKVSRAVIDYLLSTPLLYKDDLLRYRAYYYYWPYYPGYWHWSFHDLHHDLHHYDSHSYGHLDSHYGGLHH